VVNVFARFVFTVLAPALLLPSSVMTIASFPAVPVTVRVAVAALNVKVLGTERSSRVSRRGRKRLLRARCMTSLQMGDVRVSAHRLDIRQHCFALYSSFEASRCL